MKYFLLALLCLPNFTLASIEITEVMCNPVGSDSDREWVKIKNTGTSVIDITGWKFNDGSNHILNVPPKNGGVGDMLIDSGEEALLANDATKVSGASTVIDTVMSMSNSGDTVSLINNDGDEVHTVTYTSDQVTEGESCSAVLVSASGSMETQVNDTLKIREVTQYRTVEVEPPQDIFVRDMSDIVSVFGGVTYIKPELYNSIGKVTNSGCYITFGDGSYGNQCSTSHIYEYPGDYVIKVLITEGVLHDETALTVSVTEPDFRLRLSGDNKFVEIFNDDSSDTELNQWSLVVDSMRFKIPDGTIIAASSSIKISGKTMRIDIARRGGLVRLVNVFNSTIAGSDEFFNIDAVPTQAISEDIQEKSASAIDVANVTEEASKTIPIKSIIGRKISMPYLSRVNDAIAVSDVQDRSVLPVDKSNNAVLGASVSLLPDEYGKWAVGLLALMGIAMTPLLLTSSKDGGHEDLYNGDSDTFTVEEVK